MVFRGIQPNSEAYIRGLQDNWVLERLNGQSVESVADFERITDGYGTGSLVSLVFRDGTGARFIVNYIVR